LKYSKKHEAIDLFKRHPSHFPTDAAAYFKLGNLYSTSGEEDIIFTINCLDSGFDKSRQA